MQTSLSRGVLAASENDEPLPSDRYGTHNDSSKTANTAPCSSQKRGHRALLGHPCSADAKTTLHVTASRIYVVLTVFYCSDARSKVEFSKDGRIACAIGTEDVSVVDIHNQHEVLKLPLREVLHVGFSSRDAYLITLQRPNKQLKGAHTNLQVWEVATGKCVWGIHRSSVNDDDWPVLQWLEDDSAVFISVANTVHVYTPSDAFSHIAKKLPVKNIASFAISPGKNPKLAAYVPESKSAPATILIYPFSGFPKTADEAPVVTNRKSFYRVSGVKFLWNSVGSALLCSSFSDVDVTNQSYYGEQHLHFFEGDSDVATLVPNIPKGPIHDVQWTAPGDHFAVVAGFMPAKTLLFDSKCKPLFDLGSGAYNFVRFNPFGRFLCVAGFGNLPGDIVFYEKKGGGTCKKLNSIRSPSVSLEWSPCGRYVLTAITAPRLRVDNGFKVFSYMGEEIGSEQAEVLLEARWLPVEEGTFTDRPVSPQRRSTISHSVKPEDTTAAYVPPHLRGREGARAATSLNLGQSNDAGGRIRTETKGPEVPGSTFVSKSAAKNAKRRAKKRTEGPKSPDLAEAAAQQEALDPVLKGALETDAEPAAPADDKLKRIRALRKKLKQIAQLKESMTQPGVTLEADQLRKIETEATLIAELELLEC